MLRICRSLDARPPCRRAQTSCVFNSNGARTSLLVTAVAPLVLIGVVIVVCVAKRLLGSANGKPLRKGALDALPWLSLIHI